ncbi:hypothetical protein D3C86_2104570 [compost metagenome]
MARVLDLLREAIAGLLRHVHESDACALFDKRRYDGSPDAAAATGDEDRAVPQAGKPGETTRFGAWGGRA